MGILGQIDDLIGVTEADFKAQQMNAFLNVKTADKYLQFGPDKCKTMVIGSTKITNNDFIHTQLKVDTWEVTYDNEENIIENLKEKTVMEDVNELLYLGVVISCDGKNTKKHSVQKKQIPWDSQTNHEHGEGMWKIYN